VYLSAPLWTAWILRLLQAEVFTAFPQGWKLEVNALVVCCQHRKVVILENGSSSVTAITMTVPTTTSSNVKRLFEAKFSRPSVSGK